MFEKVHLGIAPIGWTNDDMPQLGGELTFEQMISEAALAGFQGTEVGGKFPTDPAALKHALDDQQKRLLAPAFSVATLAFIGLFVFVTMYIYPLRYQNIPENLSRLQMHTRKFVALACAGAITCSAFSLRWIHALLGNPVLRFISGLSYQIYLWHMAIALALKDWHLPPFSTQTPMDDVYWRFPYLMLCIAITAMTALVMTFGVERPLSGLLLSHAPRWAREPEKRQQEAGHA